MLLGNKPSFSVSDTTLTKKLNYAHLADVNTLLEEYFNPVNTNGKPSLLYRYYPTVEPVISCVRLFRQTGMEPPARLLEVQDMERLMQLVPSMDQVAVFARELLRGGDMKLSQIAEAIGYSEPNYFSHILKKHVGLSPREYRAQGREPGGSESPRNPGKTGLKNGEYPCKIKSLWVNYFNLGGRRQTWRTRATLKLHRRQCCCPLRASQKSWESGQRRWSRMAGPRPSWTFTR